MYRAFFAMGDTLASPDGRPVGAIHGYLDMVVRLMRKRNPDEVIHCYDHDWRPMARTDMYAGYKADRPPMPPELEAQFEMLRTVLGLAGASQAQAPDWEAEDAMGALCARAAATDRIEMVSGDRDLIQLVQDPVVQLLYTVRGVSELHEFNEAAVKEKYGVPPQRYAEFAILRGDPSDGLPGVKGVGEKTALALVSAYDSLEALLGAAEAPEPPPEGPLARKPALRATLAGSRAYVETMQKLVPINTAARIDEWSGDPDAETLQMVAEDLGISGPLKRLAEAGAGKAVG